MPTRYWIGVVSREHVLRGVAGGFAQVGHGKGAPLRRMAPGDWLFYYSPKTSLDGGEALQAFTAAGRVAEGDVYQGEMTSDVHPLRRDVVFEPAAREAPIAPLKAQLSITAGNPRWGMAFRRGHLEVPEADARLIAEAMGFALPSSEDDAPEGAPPYNMTSST